MRHKLGCVCNYGDTEVLPACAYALHCDMGTSMCMCKSAFSCPGLQACQGNLNLANYAAKLIHGHDLMIQEGTIPIHFVLSITANISSD